MGSNDHFDVPDPTPKPESIQGHFEEHADEELDGINVCRCPPGKVEPCTCVAENAAKLRAGVTRILNGEEVDDG